MSPTELPDQAWAWILEHRETIDRIVGRCYRDARTPDRYAQADFSQDVMLELARRHDDYDPERGSPGTWIWWQARTVLRHQQRRDILDQRHEIAERALVQQDRSWSTIIDRIDLDRVMSVATEKQREALFCIAAGISGEEVRERFGVSYQAMQNRLTRSRLTATPRD